MADINYFSRNNFQLLRGESLQILHGLKDQSYDLIFADPPYFLGKDQWDTSKGVEEDYKFQEAWLKECRRLLKPSGTIWVSGTHHSIYQCGFALQKLGFHILNEVVWYKPRSMQLRTNRLITPSHETLIWASKSAGSKYIYNYGYMKHSTSKEDFLKQENEELKSVWAINAPGKLEKQLGEHPAQKPTQLLKRIILACTKPGDLVLDPFSGSGTTGIVSRLYGRTFIGIEKEEKYLEIAVKRFIQLEENLRNKNNLQK